MLKKQRPLHIFFFVWILGGLLAVFVAPVLVKISLCEAPSRQEQRPVHDEKQPSQNNDNAEQINYVTAEQKQQSAEQKGKADRFYKYYLNRSGFCEEAKLTDIALVFFTYCLVVVGWFTVRSGERSTHQLERPYIFGTPQLKQHPTPAGNRAVEIMLQNYGRTAGTVLIVYGELSPNVEPFGTPAYGNGSARAANGMIPPTEGKAVRAPVTFECPVTADFFFFGYVDYEDLFGRKHTSRFCAKMFLNGGIEAAGSEAFHDWN
jgi:hypothetical protein